MINLALKYKPGTNLINRIGRGGGDTKEPKKNWRLVSIPKDRRGMLQKISMYKKKI